jgi:hypothetical protein
MVIPAFFHGATISIKFVAFNFHSINIVKNKCDKSLKNGFTLNTPSLRAKRGNPAATVELDCHVASLLAMTRLSDVCY